MPRVRAMSARFRFAAMFALAAAVLAAGCSSDATNYPSGWTPLASGRHGCPELAGTWRVRDPASTDSGLKVFTESDVVNPQHRSVHWDVVSIATDPDGNGITLKFVQQAWTGRNDAQTLQRHVRTDIATCERGLATIERRERGGSDWTVIRLGKDAMGRLVGQRVDRTSGEPLLRWGDQSALSLGHSTHAVWSRWEPIPAQTFASIAGAVERESGQPVRRPARGEDASPFVAASTPFKAPTLPLPAAPATRPGALPMGEAQAIVLGALPDNAVFLGMTPTPRGYSLRVSGLDAQAMTQLSRRLAIDGHFTVQADAPAAAASGASAPAPAREAGAEMMLELVERLAY